MNPVLTIGFPTYNNGKVLKETLDQLISQIGDMNIEVLISDNASEDETYDIGTKYSKEYYYVKYRRNEKNLEFDGNCIEIFKHARGNYLWMIGDDHVFPNAVSSIISSLEKNPIFVHLNFTYIKNEKNMLMDEPRYKGSNFTIFNDKNNFLKTMGLNATFLSSLIFNMKFVKEISNFERYNGTFFLFYHVAIITMNNPGLFIINNTLCVAGFGNNNVRYDVYRVWIKNYGDILLKTALEQKFSKEVLMDILYNDLSNSIIGYVIYYKLKNKSSKYWDVNSIWEYIDLFPDLKFKYRKAIKTPRIIMLLNVKAKNFFKKIKDKLSINI